MPLHTVELELPLPGDVPDIVPVMRAAIDKTLPTGERLAGMVGEPAHIGMDMGQSEEFWFKPCWRMVVTYRTEVIDPMVWEGD